MSKPINLLGYKNISAGNLIKKLDIRGKKWKNRALKYQKEKRAMATRIRDLQISKEKYKSKLLSIEGSSMLKESPLLLLNCASTANSPKGSTYSYWQIEVSLDWYLHSSIGFRSMGEGWTILSKHLPISTPSYSVIRQWVLRLGLYKLQQPVEQATDWVYILDYSIQMSTEYCLVILGFRLSDWRARDSQGLTLQQVQVLDLVVTEHPRGEEVQKHLNSTMLRTGVPIQIVSDGGRNLLKGQRLWKEDLPDPTCVISTYDVSHLIGCLLKSLLAENESWKGLVKAMNCIQKRNQQSYAGFIAPLSLRKTARYMNLYAYTDYLERLLAYQQKEDFSLLARNWAVDMTSLEESIPPPTIEALAQLECSSEKELIHCLEQIPMEKETLSFQHDGKEEFESRFGGLAIHQPFILVLLTLVKWIRVFQKELKTQGLSKKLIEKWKKRKPDLPVFVLEKFWQPLMNRLTQQIELLPDDQVYLATSDIIESLFGCYKAKVSAFWLKGMSPLVLMMPALAGGFNQQIIEQALQKIKIEDVQKWFDSQRTTQSFLTKRKKALPAIKQKTKNRGKPQHTVVHLKKTVEKEKKVA